MNVCIACQGDKTEQIKELQEYKSNLMICSNCGLAFIDPVPEEETVRSLYQDNFYEKEGALRFMVLFEKIIFLHRWFRSKRLQKLVRKGIILDIGFSRGLTLYLLKKKGWDPYGTQISHNAVVNARDNLGIEVYEGDLIDQKLESDKFDVITLWHVLEHLRNPDRYLKEVHKLLRKHGTLVLEVPNFGSPIARFFGDHWFGLDPPHHLYNFTEESLKSLLAQYGFKAFRVTYFSLEHSPFSLLQSILNSFSKDRNLLYRFLQIRKQPFQKLLKGVVHTIFALCLIIPVTLASLLFGLFRKGDVATFYCEKLDVDKPA